MTMKTVSRNKFSLCFRPVVDMDMAVLESEDVVVNRSCKRSLTCISIKEGKDENMEPLVTNKSIRDKESREHVECRTKSSSKRTLSRVIRAVVFETILSKRVRYRKAFRKNSARSKNSFPVTSTGLEHLRSCEDESTDDIQAEDEEKLTMCLSPSRSSYISVPNVSRQTLKDSRTETGHSAKSKSGLLVLLLSLTFTIVWGKLCAILFTSIWLYFLASGKPSKKEIKFPEEIESREYKKKVIMEGLLERNKVSGHSILT